MSNLSEKISTLRQRYERECAELNKKYSSLISSRRAEVSKIESTDYYLGYIESYTASLGTLEEIYREIEVIQKRTLGIEFRVGNYLPTLTARPAETGAIDYFSRLVSECREAIMLVRNSATIEGDVIPLKRFCQGLVDLRYLVKNARALLKMSGDPDAEKADALREAKEALSEALAEEKEAKKFENLACYAECMALKGEIADNALKMDSIRLGDAPRGESLVDSSYKFLIGFSEAKLPEKDRVFAEKTLGADPRGLTAYPVYFNYTGYKSTLIVRASDRMLFSKKILGFARNLYFSVAGSVYSKGVVYFGAECNPVNDRVIGKVAYKIKQTLNDKFILYHSDAPSSTNYPDLVQGFEKLDSLWNDRSQMFGDDIETIFDYNRQNPDSKLPIVMANIWGYPDLFTADSMGRLYNSLHTVCTGRGDEGIMMIIGEKTDGAFTDKAPRLDPDILNADVIEFDDDGNARYNGEPIDVNIESTGFDVSRYWDNLKKYYESLISTSLIDTMSHIEADRARGFKKKLPYYDKFIIPMGAHEDSSGFEVEISFSTNQCFGIILGGTRSGKSSFLHSFILSACSQYAPDEVQFYLADFKASGDEAPEFSNYKNVPGLRNLCMPHVRYLLLQSSPENTVDLLNKIISLMKERNRFMRTRASRPYTSCVEYNKSPEVRSGSAPKLPFVFFLIDEANNMMTGGLSDGSGNSREDNRILGEIKNKLQNILKQSASAGIGVLFAGQDTRGFEEGHIDQMGTRICLKVDNEQIFRNIFNIEYRDTATMIRRLEMGKAYYTNMGKRMSPVFVRTAYAGSTAGDQALGIAEKIRAEYEKKPEFCDFCRRQILAGNESFVTLEDAKRSAENFEDDTVDTTSYVTRHNILMGISSASGIPSYVKYDTNSDSSGYYAVAPEEKLISIERAAMFSFLEKFENADGSCPEVDYYALPGLRRASMDCLLTNAQKFAKCFNAIRRQSDLAIKIMELWRLFNKRQRMLTNDEADSFDPILLVVHNPDFIYNKKNTEWMPDFDGGKKKDRKKDRSDEIDDVLDDLLDGGEEDDMSWLNDVSLDTEDDEELVAEDLGAEEEEVEPFTATEVRDALTTLFSVGNRYSIYVLVLATTEKIIDMVCPGATSSRSFCIYSSLDELRGNKNKKTGAGSAYILPDGIKTRLIEYTPEDLNAIADKFF